jgi:hypothetical protein
VYGNDTLFGSIPFIVKLFKLAHEMQLNTLVEDAAHYIVRNQEYGHDEVFEFFDLCVQVGCTLGVRLCSNSEVCSKYLVLL